MENITVPMNVREEFDVSEINVGMNAKESPSSANVYVDDTIYVPDPDPRELNVVNRIAEINKMYEDGKLPIHD